MKRLTSATGLACAVLAATTHAADEPFSFEKFKRRDFDETDVTGAMRNLSPRLPVGTKRAAYEEFFRAIGGQCAEVADAKRFPNTLLCTYSHGKLVTAEWHLVVRYDPVSLTTREQELSFGLTGL